MAARLSSIRALKFSLILLIGWVWVTAAVYLSDPDRGPRDPAWERIRQEGIIRVGVDPSIAPFGVWMKDGGVSGLDPALAQALAERLDLKAHLTPLTYDGLYNVLLNGDVDMVIAALRPDPFRADVVQYTSPYFDAGHVLVSRNGVENFDQLDGKTLSVELASEGDMAARQFENITTQRYLTAAEALAAVSTEKADAALVNSISAYFYLADHEGLVSSQIILPDPYVIAIRRSDWRLYRAVEEDLNSLRRDGTLNNLIKSWMGGS